MEIAQTDRLRIRWLDVGDAPFILELVNEPSWIRYIGDKGVRTLEDAQRYLASGPIAMYRERGFGLNLVQLKENGEPIGMCGLLKRETLDDVDLGFAFLPRHWANGYALESASAVLMHGRRVLGLARVVAILSRDNLRSARLLEKLGFHREGTVEQHGEQLSLYASRT